jgi:hypothetical protein
MNPWPKNFGYRRPGYVNDQKIHVRVLWHFLTTILLRLLFPRHLTVEAPLIRPANNASNPTTDPIAMPTWVTRPPATSLMTIAPVPAKTRQKVPMNSAAAFFSIDDPYNSPGKSEQDESHGD